MAGWIPFAIYATLAAGQLYEQRKARKAMDAKYELERAFNERVAARKQQEQIRDTAIATAKARAKTSASGAAGSAAIGEQQALVGNLAVSNAFLEQQKELGSIFADMNKTIGRHQEQSAMFGTIFDVYGAGRKEGVF
jgi:hypothetical protein